MSILARNNTDGTHESAIYIYIYMGKARSFQVTRSNAYALEADKIITSTLCWGVLKHSAPFKVGNYQITMHCTINSCP